MYQQPMSPALLTKALLRAAEQLDLAANLAELLRPSAPTVMPAMLAEADDTAQLLSGSRLLDPEKPEWASALRIVGMFRTLIELLNTPERARAWLGTPNEALGGTPLDLLRSPDAELVHRYLSAVRKHELRMPPAWRREHRDELQ